RRSDVPGLPERPERSQRGDTTGERPAIGLSPAGLPQRRPQQHRPPEPSLAPGDPLLDSDHGESDFGREPSRPSLLESTVSMPRPRPGEDDEVDHDADWNGTQTDLPAVTPEEDPDYDAEIAARVQAEAAEDARLAWERAGSGTFGDLGEPVPRHGRTADTVKTAAFFQSRIKPPSAEDTSGIPIFAEMMSGWLSDWQEGMPRPAFETIADEGWSAAQRVAEAASTVNNSGAVTESGLPQRRPGEWLIPGAVGSSPEPISPPVFANATLGGDDSAAGLPERSETAPELPRRGAARMDVPAPAEDEAQLRRDPETVRASLARHQTGVRNGRAMTTMKATRDEGDQ
ncbi:MAG: hypothetical protein HOQ24_13210, partial [Mycobacteriaceae bacterium]|nr:hypothetical protein [Mycobacteriaceae bacterium]